MRWPVRVFLVPLFAFACGQGSGSSGGKDAGRDSPAPDTAGISLPEVPPGCPPDGGNENGIGKPCTATGTECTGTLQCSCKNWFGYTMPASMPCFCTNVAFGSTCSNCGSNAPCCTYTIPVSGTNITVSACFPSVCLSGNQCPVIN
jgi:hypothetical protein